MPEIRIWYKAEGKKPEVIERTSSFQSAQYLLHEYRMAFSVLPRQHRYQKDKIWMGRRDQEP